MADNTTNPIIILESFTSGTYSGNSNLYSVETITGKLYLFFMQNGTPVFITSVNYGKTWSTPTSLHSTTTGSRITIWYDRWSGIEAGLIHVAFSETTTDDVSYINIDTENSDTLSSVYTVYAGTSDAAGYGSISITRTRGGNLLCGGNTSTSAPFFYKSSNVGVNWTTKAALDENTNPSDKIILLPGWAADNNDAMAFYWDASATELSIKLYDDSANSWSEISIATTIVNIQSSPASYLGNWNASVDITNSQNILIAWSARDTANANLRCWKITESAITEVTNVIENSTDDQGFAALSINTNSNYWYAFYAGLSDGTETFPSYMTTCYKVSTDSGATWSSEYVFTKSKTMREVKGLVTCPRVSIDYHVFLLNNLLNIHLLKGIELREQQTNFQIGI